ncbi:hypothetical protein COD89_22110 [Bacillus thuringiensis]|nr:hypothetical protein CON12_19370 [Bacillus thuringiensis]PGV55732.1 hypothetical protein COD89_22110 [Bacillus thuringiensis]
MRKMGIKAKIRKKKWSHFGLKEQCVVSENLLNREFSTTRPKEKWVTDITYLTFNTSEYNNLKLVTDTVNKALRKRKVHETVLHSDRGYQNKSKKI